MEERTELESPTVADGNQPARTLRLRCVTEPDAAQKALLSRMGLDHDKLPFKFYRGMGCSKCGNLGFKGRTVIEEELEAVFAGKKDAKAALDEAVRRGNEILRQFEAANK